MTSSQDTQIKSSQGAGLWTQAWQKLRRSRLNMFCLWIVVAYTLVAIGGEGVYWFYKWKDVTPPYKVASLDERYIPPVGFRDAWIEANPDVLDERGAFFRPFGTDGLGRDVLQRVVQGTRIAYEVGVVTAMIAIPIGVLLGCLAGYFGGRTDDFIVWLYSTFASIPGLLFILAIAMVVGKGILGVFLGIGLTMWVGLCRLIRGEVIKHKNRVYVQALKALGYGPFRILFRHILPNITHIIIVTFTIRFPAAIGTEVILTFLGVGVEGEPSWGEMINSSRLRLWQGVWWEMAAATLAVFFIVLAFNLLGDALRDALDPRLRTERAD